MPSLPEDEEMVAKLRSAFDAITGDAGDIEAEDLRNILNRVFENKGVFQSPFFINSNLFLSLLLLKAIISLAKYVS